MTTISERWVQKLHIDV